MWMTERMISQKKASQLNTLLVCIKSPFILMRMHCLLTTTNCALLKQLYMQYLTWSALLLVNLGLGTKNHFASFSNIFSKIGFMLGNRSN